MTFVKGCSNDSSLARKTWN